MAYQIQVRNRAYTVVDDVSTAYFALINGAVQDEVTGTPPRTRTCVVAAGRDAVYIKTTNDGLYCVAGYPGQTFPNLSTTPYTVELKITAPGYRGTQVPVTVPQNATFPVSGPVVRLRPLPVRIQGRVVENTTARNPISGAKIAIVDDPGSPAPLTEHVIALRTPLRFEHAGGVTVRQRQFSAVGAAKLLAAVATGGSRTLTLSSRTGLAVGDVLRIGPAIDVEYGVIESLAPQPAGLTQPGDVTLRSGLRRSFAEDAEVQKVTPGVTGVARTLAQEVDADDGVLILDGVLDVDTVEIVDPVPQHVEYHALGALTDGEGFYRLDGVGRVHTLHLRASSSGFIDRILPWTVDYDRSANIVNYRL